MLVVGERINSTRKRIRPAVEGKDVAVITDEAKMQVEAGATYLDCNAAMVGLEKEPEYLTWLVETVQSVTGDTPIALDSPNPKAILAALKVHKGVPMLNSISAESEKYAALMPIVRDAKTKVVALLMDDSGMPKDGAARIAIGRKLVARLIADGVEPEAIYVDPLVSTIGAEGTAAIAVVETIRTLKCEFPGIHFIGGLSNVSYGLPNRALLNQAFTVLAIGAGLDAAIIDPMDKKLMALACAAEALVGRDEFCMEYIGAARAGKLE